VFLQISLASILPASIAASSVPSFHNFSIYLLIDISKIISPVSISACYIIPPSSSIVITGIPFSVIYPSNFGSSI
jgi:hypothetical protein